VHVSHVVLQSMGPLPFSLSPRLSARPSERGASPVLPVTTSPSTSFRVWNLSCSPCLHVSQYVLQSVGPLPFPLSPRLSVRPSERGTYPTLPVTSYTQRLRNYTTWDVPVRCPSSSYDIFRGKIVFSYIRKTSFRGCKTSYSEKRFRLRSFSRLTDGNS
jgi:hypothetical protein